MNRITAKPCYSREIERESYTLDEVVNEVNFICGIKNRGSI